MKVELMDITPHAEDKIASYAAICYDSDTSVDANVRRIKHLMKVKHLSTLRHAMATFKVSNISRTCSHQLVRSKHLDYLQRSQRYCHENDSEFIIPPALSNEPIYKKALKEIQCAYESLLLIPGIRKEDARFVLPNATVTELIVSGNLQAWKDFIALRTVKAAQWEIRNVALEVHKQLKDECPNVFEGMVEDE